MKAKIKINKGHYHEITDRIDVERNNIQNNLIDHPVIQKNKKLKRKLEEAQSLLGDVYQKTALCIT